MQTDVKKKKKKQGNFKHVIPCITEEILLNVERVPVVETVLDEDEED